ncbi:hypothetical protein K0M31_015893 [Melipona bicolor]|uniref:Uncharacterized protein n=1 Tax=Melipona bicolor TaxID=60889 RepID=A0AA40G6R4_9HYME|nr:hypothetical protein K0M31_015893 [Melipona bicolor]
MKFKEAAVQPRFRDLSAVGSGTVAISNLEDGSSQGVTVKKKALHPARKQKVLLSVSSRQENKESSAAPAKKAPPVLDAKPEHRSLPSPF